MKKSDSLPFDLQTFFGAIPDLYLVLATDLTIVGASKAYLAMTHFKEEELIGRYIFDAFPNNPSLPDSDASQSLSQSLQWVLANKKPHQLDVARYDMQLPPDTGQFEERYWVINNTPILDADGNIRGIINKVIDVTEQTVARNLLAKNEEQIALLHKEQHTSQSALMAAKAEVELERQKLYNVLMQAPALICMFEGPSHVFKFVNPPYQQLVGDRSILGKPILEAMPELGSQAIQSMLDKVYQTGETVHANEMMVQLDHQNDGSLGENYYNFIYQAIRDINGSIEGIMVFAYEVTAQVKARQELITTNQELHAAQKALRELNQHLERRIDERTHELELSKAVTELQRNRLQRLFMDAPIPFLVLEGPEHTFNLVNPAFQKIFPGRSLLGYSLLEGLPEMEGTPIPDILDEVYRTGRPYEAVEYPMMISKYADEPLEEIFFTFTYQARRNEQGEIDAVLVFALDVTEHVKARHKIERAAERLRLITDSLPVLIGYLDTEERYQFANKAYEAWFPIKAEDLLGRAVRDIVGDKAYQGVKQYIDRALAGERLEFESRMPYREDFTKYIHTNYVPDIRDGEVKGFYTLVQDVTDQVTARMKIEEREQEALGLTQKLGALNDELTTSNSQLLRTNVDLDNFIYAASHDLKAPIFNIERLLLILLESIPEEAQSAKELKQVINMIENSIERFKRTIDHLTDVTKLQKENNQEASEISLGKLVHDVELDLSNQLEESDAILEVDLNGCEAINFSEKNLRSIIYNLLSNAIKYRSPERRPHIHISCTVADEHVLLSVQDNGLGLTPAGQRKIFSMFTRLHDHVEGSGIGLYMVKKIVENAEGHIEVESELGKGSTFRIYLKR